MTTDYSPWTRQSDTTPAPNNVNLILTDGKTMVFAEIDNDSQFVHLTGIDTYDASAEFEVKDITFWMLPPKLPTVV